MRSKNIILKTDSYKPTHWPQYPKGIWSVYSYFESRGGQFQSVVFSTLQYFLIEYLEGQVVTLEKINEAEEIFKLHFGTDKLFNKEGWLYILEKHNGRLPVSIHAVAEGSVIPTHNVLMTIENTDPKCYWLTNYLETILVQVWYGCTVATYSRECKKVILQYLEETGNPELINFKLHDFGFRGVTCPEQAGIGGFAHLINFMGTDNLESLVFARDYYGVKTEEGKIAGYSIPASEHSTITSWGKDHELDAMKNMLEKYPTGPVACVSDSYNIYNACEKYWGTELKEMILKRDGCLIVRPDSGYPPEVVVKVLDILSDKLGYEFNEKGYKVLNPKVRIIQGDGIDLDMLKAILSEMKKHNYSADNIAFGSGGGLLQKHNRDSQKFAFKCSSVVVNGETRDVYKEPVTDGGKKSKAGRLFLVEVDSVNGKNIRTMTFPSGDTQLLKEVFRNGEILKNYDLETIRQNAQLTIEQGV